MAEVLSGSLSTNNYSTQSSGTIGLKLTWTATQSIENNTSTIKWTLVSKGSMSSSTWVTCYGVEVKINGTKVLNTTSSFHMYGDGKYKKTGTITVAHNASGGKSVAMSVKGKIYQNAWNCTDDDTFTLKTINRYALIASATDFTNESYPKIVYTNPAGTALTTGLKARIVWNERASYSDWVTLNDEGGEYTFTASTLTTANINSMLALCPNSNYLTVEVDLQSTMNGVDYHNYKSIMMSVINSNPTFSVAPTYEDANDDIYAITGNRSTIVRKQSKLRIFHGTASARNGASLANNPYILNFNGVSYGFLGNYIEFDKPDIAGTYRATITAMDTRGNTATSYIDITVHDWAPPNAECTIERQNSFERFCDLLVKANYSSVDNINTLTITEEHRTAGSGSWSTPDSVTNNSTKVIELANTSAWDIKITVSDRFATVTYNLSVGKGIPYIYKDTYNNSIGFNAIPDKSDQIKIGEGCPVEVGDVGFPHKYSSTKHAVGIWHDGRTIYEKTITMSQTTVSTGSWYDIETLASGDPDIQVLDMVAYNESSAGNNVWRCIAGQYIYNTKKVSLYNARGTSMQINAVTYQYVEIPAQT